jgi:hypothetical protein
MVRHAPLEMVSEMIAPERAERSLSPPPAPCREPAPKIVYFAQDLADPAVRKRVRMLRAGGATVSIFGFQRGAARLDETDCERGLFSDCGNGVRSFGMRTSSWPATWRCS